MKNPDQNTEETSLPGLSTWPKVYWFVGGSFLLWVALLWLLTQTFSA